MLAGDLQGVRVLVLEDEFLLGLLLEQDLRAAGCVVLGPFRSLAQGFQAVREQSFDLAILDINLAGEFVYPLAEELMGSGRPFLFLSGYSAADMPAQFRSVPRLSKPYDPALLVQAARQARQGRA
jgi:DNA-binding response OmpR family regulator